jgi:hypothetical protein
MTFSPGRSTGSTLHRRIVFGLSAGIVASLVVVAVVEACGINIVFRAYLDRALWRPATTSIAELLKGRPVDGTRYTPYAGMTAGGGSVSLQGARDAYRALFPDQPRQAPDAFQGTLNWPELTLAKVRDIVYAAQATTPTEEDELDLLRCKVELRVAKPDDQAALTALRICFDTYRSRPRPPAFDSEARGWIARTDYLRGRYAAAAKFYWCLCEVASASGSAVGGLSGGFLEE